MHRSLLQSCVLAAAVALAACGSTPGGTGRTAGGSGGGVTGSGGAGGFASGTGGAGAQSMGGQSSGGQSMGGQSSGGQSMGGQSSGGQSTGGQSNGGAGTGGRPTAPVLVTSGPNAYWVTDAPLTKITTGTAGLTVNAGTKYQTWSGFGGTFNEMGWDALNAVSSQIATAMKLLFDPIDGANFVTGRIPLGASDYAMSWYTLDDTTTPDPSMASFSIARDQQRLIPYIKAALMVRADIYFWASPWIVPDWMMDSAGNMKGDAQTQGAFALYLAKFVEEYAKVGIDVRAIHPQNEPGYAQVHWTQTLFIDFFKTYLGPTFAQRKVPAEIWCGTMSAPADGTIATTLATDSAAMQYVKGFGLQWNLQSTVAALAPKGPVWQTEHKCGNYPFNSAYWSTSRYDPNMPQNDHAYGEESWQLIRDWITAGVNAYSAWNMVLDTKGMSLANWPQNALLVVDRNAKTLTATAAYWAFRHYSRYIAVGATRVGTSGTNDAVAFQNPDGSIVTEVYNSGTAAKTMTVGVGGALYQFAIPAHGWATLVTP